MDQNALSQTARKLVSPGKGILAADESTGTIKKRFDKINVESTPETHRIYRQLLFTTDGIEQYISGVIMFDETIRQKADPPSHKASEGQGGKPFPQLLSERGIVPGIKVDKGKVDIPNFPGEKVTEGIDGLRDRLKEYFDMGAKFTKWRAIFSISENLPTDTCIETNSDLLARFATYSQEVGLVPIVEPEVLTEGSHGIKKCEQATYRVLKKVFEKLSLFKVHFPGMLLKPNWVMHGKDTQVKAETKEIAEGTLRVMREVVPPEVPGLVFLSGGATPEASTSYIDLMNEIDQVPWQISFSFGRALQGPVLEAWRGDNANIEKAQKEFYKRARLNSLARTGEYEEVMESEKNKDD
jgi:fructose-bisphosphate aldolase class I